MAQKKILLAQLNSNGDCLYATVIARQIKELDHPGCHLVWAVNSKSMQSILRNPYVDEIWEVQTERALTNKNEWAAFVKDAERRRSAGEFDIIFYTQIIGKNVINLNGDIRDSIYKNYPKPIRISQQPVVKLADAEVQNVQLFAEEHGLEKYRWVILLECGPDSFHSSLNPASAVVFANELAAKYKDVVFILSSNKKITGVSAQVIDGSVLTFRQNAALTKYCHLLIGCSSGISWISTSSAAKEIPKTLIINDKAVLNSSMVSDHEKAGLPTDNIIELHESKDVMIRLSDCFEKLITGGVAAARAAYHQQYKRKNFKYLYHVAQSSFAQWNFVFPFKAFGRAVKKDGLKLNAVYNILKAYIKLPLYIIKNGIKAMRR